MVEYTCGWLSESIAALLPEYGRAMEEHGSSGVESLLESGPYTFSSLQCGMETLGVVCIYIYMEGHVVIWEELNWYLCMLAGNVWSDVPADQTYVLQNRGLYIDNCSIYNHHLGLNLFTPGSGEWISVVLISRSTSGTTKLGIIKCLTSKQTTNSGPSGGIHPNCSSTDE